MFASENLDRGYVVSVLTLLSPSLTGNYSELQVEQHNQDESLPRQHPILKEEHLGRKIAKSFVDLLVDPQSPESSPAEDPHIPELPETETCGVSKTVAWYCLKRLAHTDLRGHGKLEPSSADGITGRLGADGDSDLWFKDSESLLAGLVGVIARAQREERQQTSKGFLQPSRHL